MNILTLPLRNLRRKFPRTAILIAVFTVGILSVVMLYNVSTAIGKSMEEKMTAFGANIVIYPKTDDLKIGYGGFSMGNLSYQVKYLPEQQTVHSIKNIKLNRNISTVAPKLVELAYYNTKPVTVIGVDFGQEKRIKKYWTVDGGETGAIAGSRAARLLGLKTGSAIKTGSGTVTITGILKPTGTEDDNIIFTDLHRLQSLTGKKNLINYVDVAALCSACPIDDIVAEIGKALPDTDINAMQNIVKQRMATISMVQNLVLGLGAVILVIACFMLAMFMLASVNERKKEIGILRALGYSGAKIFMIFSFESLLIGAVSGILGYVGGYFSSIKLLTVLKLSENTDISFDWTLLCFTVVAVSVLSVAASAFPAVKAAQVQPTDAFSQI